MDDKKLRGLALTGLAFDAANENIGIYPQKVTGGQKPYEQRTDWMEGWNACAMAQTNAYCKIGGWLEHQLPPQHKTVIEDLLMEEQLMLFMHDDSITLAVNCSDTFYWGCSDSEDITFDEIPDLAACRELSPVHGGELWCARKRNMRPQTASYKECYPIDEWHLFDAAGPVRTDPDGAGRDALSPEMAEAWRAQHSRTA